jgi:hypothetical protein
VATAAVLQDDGKLVLSGYRPIVVGALNDGAGQTIAGQAVVGLSDDGTVCIRTQRPMDLVVDIVGYTV